MSLALSPVSSLVPLLVLAVPAMDVMRSCAFVSNRA